jgi:hypothetical protein
MSTPNRTNQEGEGATPSKDRAEKYAAAAEQHFFWYNQAAVALSGMLAVAFDVSKQGTEEFAVARARFDEARARCKIEYDILKAIVGEGGGQ